MDFKIPSLIEGVMMKLGMIPGLTFLHRWVTDFYGMQTAIDQTTDDYFGYARSAKEAVGDVRGAVRGPKKEEEAEEEAEEEFEDDFESYMQ
jgi:hypothetical protein